MSDNNINVTAPIHAATKKGKLAAAKEVFLEGDTQTVEKEIQDINSRHNTLNTKHESLSKTVQGIAATGGASTATNVTYNNANSGMDAENIQDAVDKLAKEKADSSDVTEQLDKVTIKDEDGTVVNTPFHYIQNEEFIFAKVDAEDKLLFGIEWDGTPKFGKTSEVEDRLQKQVNILAEKITAILGDDDTTSAIDTLKELKDFFASIDNTQTLTSILANLNATMDKVAIKDEAGEIQDTPFRVIENKEFIKAVVDSENRVLCGIYRETGKPYYPLNDMYHIYHNEEFLWVILDAANHPLLGIKEDGTCWAAKAQWLDDIKAIKEALSSIDATLKTFQPKEDGKGLINMEIADSFFYISNDEYIIAVVDAEDRILAGIKYDGEPYFPNHEMYSVTTNEEWLYAIIDAEGKVLGGFLADDGHMIVGSIDISNFIANAIIDVADLKERTSHLSTIENDEYLSIETDAEGNVLGYTVPDGSHYMYKVKSETIPEEFEHIEDPEGRTEITTDAEGKVMSYRDSEGKKHEHDMEVTNLEVSNLNLQGNSVNNIQDALKANGFDVKTPVDWSNADYVQIPIPRCAKINLHTDIMPTEKSGMGVSGKTCDIPCFMEFWDMQGNYFKIPILLSAQGSSSMAFVKKNLAIDLLLQDKSDAFVIKFGDWVSQDGFHLKAYYTDFFRGVGAVSYALYEQMVKTLSIDKDRPYKTLYTSKYKDYDYGTSDSETSLDRNLDTGAKCFPQGFPVIVYQNGEFYGVYSWQLKKHRDNMHMDKKNVKHIHLDGTIDGGTIFGGTINWTAFEVRNPKNLYMQESHNIQGKDTTKYNGDFPYELMGTDSSIYDSGNKDQKNTTVVKQYIIDLSTRIGELNSAVAEGKSDDEIKGLFEKYFDVSNLVDYILETNLIADGDGYSKNWQWTTYDGVKWFVNPYDHDGAFGAYHLGNYISPAKNLFYGNSKTTPVGWIYSYYKLELKNRWAELRKKGIFTTTNIIDLLTDWCSRIGYDNWKSEYKKWSESPCNRSSNINEEYWEYNPLYITTWSPTSTYSSSSVVKASDGKAYLSLTNSNVGINPVNDDGTNWKDVTYNADSAYNIGDMVCYGKNTYYKFTCKKDCVNQPPLTKFYEKYPYELGHFDSIYRVQKWVENRISYMDKLLEYENN